MSLKGDKYETVEEVQMRIDSSVVLYRDEPVFITRCRVPERGNEVSHVYFRPLPYKPQEAQLRQKMIFDNEGNLIHAEPEKEDGNKEPKEVRKYLSSRHFDLSAFPMGYFNFEGKAFRATRNPFRQYKQGLSARTAAFYATVGDDRAPINFNQALGCQGFKDMIVGNYLSKAAALQLLQGKDVESVALSRSFAIYRDRDLGIVCVAHKGSPCGVLGDDGTVKFSDKYSFLKEEFQESVN